MMAGTGVMQQSRVLGGVSLPQQKASTARPVGRPAALSTVAMAKRKVNTFDEAWKKVSLCACRRNAVHLAYLVLLAIVFHTTSHRSVVTAEVG